MSERLIELAKRIQRRPYNRPGSDKTWVVQSMWAHSQFTDEVRQAMGDHPLVAESLVRYALLLRTDHDNYGFEVKPRTPRSRMRVSSPEVR